MTPTSPSSLAQPHPRHHHTLQHLLALARLRESLAVARPPSVRNAGVTGAQAALGVAVVAALAWASPWMEYAGYATLGALAALFGRFATPSDRGRLVAVAGALLVAPVALLSGLAWLGASPVVLLLALAAAAGVLASLSHRAQLGAPGAVIFVFAASAALAPIDSGAAVLARTGAVACGAAIAWLLCRTTDRLRDPLAGPATTPPAASIGPGYALRPAARVAACAALAGLAAHAAGWSHPAWAAIGAIAVVQGAHLPGTMHRAWQRVLGTLVGAALAWALLSLQPSFWQTVLAVVVLQCITELVIGFNYAFGQAFVTPMALLMVSLAAPAGAADMALSRIADTALGAVAGVALAVLFSTLDERRHLAQHHAAGIRRS